VLKSLFRRICRSVVQAMCLTLFLFFILNIGTNDPAATLAGPSATSGQIEKIRAALHLNLPFYTQWYDWLGHAVRGDLGQSFLTNEQVTAMVWRTIGVSLCIVALGLAIAIVVGGSAGVVSAVRPRSWIDRLITASSIAAVAVPTFVVGIILIEWLAIKVHVFPATGSVGFSAGVWEWFRHLILPALTLSLIPAAEIARQLRGDLIEALGSDYALAALARGIPQRRIVRKHALKNACIPVLALMGTRFAQLLGGAVIIEQVFAINGAGSLAVSSSLSGDFPVVLGVAAIFLVFVTLINLGIDVVSSYINPRARASWQ
jgi:peptide/nickel transport system permease protein